MSNVKCQMYNSGITLLLVLLILTSLLSISIGIFDVVFAELRISGELADSFRALYAADEAIEYALYIDRDATPLPAGYTESRASSFSGGCSRIRATKTPISDTTNEVTIRVTGEFRCGAPMLSVKRAFSTTYNQPR